eukprot:3347910-Rhodomonas_salina.2
MDHDAMLPFMDVLLSTAVMPPFMEAMLPFTVLMQPYIAVTLPFMEVKRTFFSLASSAGQKWSGSRSSSASRRSPGTSVLMIQY